MRRPREVPGDPQSPATAALASDALIAMRAGQQAEFAALRDEAATAAAAELGIPAGQLSGAFAAADAEHQVAVLSALSQLGADYQYASADPEVGFDCSGLTRYAWSQAGVQLANQSGSQISNAGPLDEAEAQAGDLVYYPGHVSMYLGVDDAMVHAANAESDVELAFIPERSVEFGDPATS